MKSLTSRHLLLRKVATASTVATLMLLALQTLSTSSIAAPSVIQGNSVSNTGVSAAAISSALSSANYINLHNSVISTRLISPLYQARANQPIFINGTSPTANLAKLKSLIQNIHLAGLNQEDYWNEELDSLSSQNNPQAALQAELLAAQSLVNIASDAATGRASIRSIDLETDFKKAAFDGYQTLNGIIASSDWLSGLGKLEPQHQLYKDLKQILAQLHQAKQLGGWKSITGTSALKPGISSSDVPGVRQRLTDLNYLSLSERDKTGTLYDKTLLAAVKSFQAGMKLEADGICGKNCFGALKTSLDRRIAQVNVNLERLRWLPKTLGSKYVFVNLARQELKVIENGFTALSMNTVNGRLLRRTPTMVDRIYEVLVNPYWTVPESIAIKDLIPAQRKDPYYLYNAQVRIYNDANQEIDPYTIDWNSIKSNVPFTMRQDPGPHNSLGTVKFSLTNSRAIYLHDTPHHEDFPETTRLKSSGCVRLERPHDLANYLLQGTEFTPEQLDYMYQNYYSYPAYSIKLKQNIPVYLTYLTASIGEQGEVQFTPDYYGQDERLINASKIKEGF